MFKKLKAGVINMAKQLMENESRVVEAKCDLAKYCIEKISNGIDKVVGNKGTRAVAGIIMVGMGAGLIVSAYIKLPQ